MFDIKMSFLVYIHSFKINIKKHQAFSAWLHHIYAKDCKDEREENKGI